MNKIKQRLLDLGFIAPPLAKSSLIKGDDIVRICFTCNTFTHQSSNGTKKIQKAQDESEDSFLQTVNKYVDEHFG